MRNRKVYRLERYENDQQFGIHIELAVCNADRIVAQLEENLKDCKEMLHGTYDANVT